MGIKFVNALVYADLELPSYYTFHSQKISRKTCCIEVSARRLLTCSSSRALRTLLDSSSDGQP